MLATLFKKVTTDVITFFGVPLQPKNRNEGNSSVASIVAIAFFVVLQLNQKEEGDCSFAVTFFATLQENEKKRELTSVLGPAWVPFQALRALRNSKQAHSSTPSSWCSYSPPALACDSLAPLPLTVLMFVLLVLALQQLLSSGDGMSTKSTGR